MTSELTKNCNSTREQPEFWHFFWGLIIYETSSILFEFISIWSSWKKDLLKRYLKNDLEHIRKVYARQKNDPPSPRNFPPISARIAWARQLWRRIDEPMEMIRPLHDDFKILATKNGQELGSKWIKVYISKSNNLYRLS